MASLPTESAPGTVTPVPQLPAADPAADPRHEPAPARSLVCARCGHAVTDDEARVSVRGKHVHTRINPGGWVHRFGCFRAAPGAVAGGPATEAHTWFPGCAWSLAHCASCGAHLGWRFVGEGEFYGLLLEQLRSG